MAFNASVNLGTVGNGITGQTVSISGCTGASCGSGCTSLVTSQAVSSFPKTISSIPDGTVSLFVKVDGGDCSGTTQCISITGIPGVTPTPTTTSTTVTPTITPTTTTTPTTVDPTITPTTTTTTVTPTITPTTTITPTSLPGCSSTVTGEYTGPTIYNYPDRQLDFTGVANGSLINFTCTANDRPNNISIRTDLTIIESTGWFGNSSGYDSNDYWYPTQTGPITLTITYDNTQTYYIDVLTAPMLAAPNDVNDYWEVSIQCLGVPTLTPTVTPTTVYVYYRAEEVMDTNISTTYCNNFGSGGQGYLINSPFYTTDAILTPGTTTIYSDYGLTTPVAGSWSLGNVTRMAYITESENQSAQNTPTTTNPNGDLLYDGGTYKFIRVDSNGGIISVGNDSCSGGPGGPSEA
jgi:hypothetical protein